MGLFSRNAKAEDLETSFQFNFDYEEPNRAYLKRMALETVISFIAKSISVLDVRIVSNGKRLYNDLHYALNVRPNGDQSSSDFWFNVVHTLLSNREVLVVTSDDGKLLIADSFNRIEYAVYDDVFTDVTVKDYTFKRNFNMNEVVYLQYGNEKLSSFMDGMFKDYTKLFNRLIEINLRSNQIRAIVGIDSTQSLDVRRQTQLQKFIDDLFKSFREKAVAIVPRIKGFEYEEVANGSETSRSVDELTKLKRSLIDEVCDILSVPQSLIHGEISDLDSAMKAYIKFCVGPIYKLIENELNAKFLTKASYLKGDRIYINGITAISPIENAEAVDKLVSSGVYTRNEVRVLFGGEPSDDPQLDEFVLTKNYETVKGGETNENSDQK